MTYRVLVCLLAALLGAGLTATTRDGMDWSGDYALYVMNAANIVEGREYGATPYVMNLENAINPSSYPPGYPLLLASVYAVTGVDWPAFKQLGIVLFAASIVVIGLLARQWLPPLIAFLATALIGTLPFVWELKDELASELPFLLFCYLALYLLEDIAAEDAKRIFARSLLVGVAIAAAIWIRPIALLLAPATALSAALQTRRVFTGGLLAAILGLLLGVGGLLVFRSDSGTYSSYFSELSVASIVQNLDAYEGGARLLLGVLSWNDLLLERVALAVLTTLAFTGFLHRCRQGPAPSETFAVTWLGAIVLYPVSLEPARYLLPVWPLIVLYAFIGTVRLTERWPSALRFAPALALAGAMTLACLSTYKSTFAAPPKQSVTDQASRELFAAIESHVPRDALVVTRKPTIVALFTQRRSSIWPKDADADGLRMWMSRARAVFVVQDLGHYGVPPIENDSLDAFVSAYGEELAPLFANENFRLYAWTPREQTK